MHPDRPRLTIDVVSDPVCPWCYIGVRSLDWAAMSLSFQYDLDIRFRPYRLDPAVPPEGVDREARIAAKFPDPEERAAMREALERAMRDVGLDFDPSRPGRFPDSTDAQRVIRWAHDERRARETAHAVFEAYWIHGEDISTPEVLAQCAEAAGLDAEAIATRLATAEDREAVRQEAMELRGGGITGVPTFIVNEQAGFAGALPKADLAATLSQLATEHPAAPAAD